MKNVGSVVLTPATINPAVEVVEDAPAVRAVVASPRTVDVEVIRLEAGVAAPPLEDVVAAKPLEDASHILFEFSGFTALLVLALHHVAPVMMRLLFFPPHFRSPFLIHFMWLSMCSPLCSQVKVRA